MTAIMVTIVMGLQFDILVTLEPPEALGQQICDPTDVPGLGVIDVGRDWNDRKP